MANVISELFHTAKLLQLFYYSEHQIVYMERQIYEGHGAFLKWLVGGRRFFRDLSVGEAAAPPQAENAEGAELPHR